MPILRLYARVLALLGRERRLGWLLATANLLLAGALFAEPVLFGRIVDVLSGKAGSGSASALPRGGGKLGAATRPTPVGQQVPPTRAAPSAMWSHFAALAGPPY